MRRTGFLTLMMTLWLALAPALSASHDETHGDAAAPEHVSCVLCQIGDRDDDAVVPTLPALQAPQGGIEPGVLAPQTGETFFILSQGIRGPPAAL